MHITLYCLMLCVFDTFLLVCVLNFLVFLGEGTLFFKFSIFFFFLGGGGVILYFFKVFLKFCGSCVC